MVKYQLTLTAEAKNVKNVQPMGGLQDPNFRYFFKLGCEECGLVTEKESWVCLNKQVLVPKIYRYVHLHQKCRDCEREGTIKMVPIPERLLKDYSDQDFNIPLMSFECTGLVPFDFNIEDPRWSVESVSGMIFEEVDLSTGDWAEYDSNIVAPIELLSCTLKWYPCGFNLDMDPKPYGCTICNQRFNTHLGALNHGHRGKHRGSQVYVCTRPWCGRTISEDQDRHHVHVPRGTRFDK